MSVPQFTVMGANGFIGRHLVEHLRQCGYLCEGLVRENNLWPDRPLGHVIYCLGVTADFRYRTFDTVRAHVSVLTDVLEKARFDSFLYLSSARVYMGLQNSLEDTRLWVDPANPEYLYNATKIAGEAVCFACGRNNVRVARPSNVFGTDYNSSNFLFAVIREAVTARHVKLRTSLDSDKDYVALDDVLKALTRIALEGRSKIYNIGSGVNTSNAQIVHALVELTGCTVSVEPGAPRTSFPHIEISRLRNEFGLSPANILDFLPDLVSGFRSNT